jgi:hypothetical protein
MAALFSLTSPDEFLVSKILEVARLATTIHITFVMSISLRHIRFPATTRNTASRVNLPLAVQMSSAPPDLESGRSIRVQKHSPGRSPADIGGARQSDTAPCDSRSNAHSNAMCAAVLRTCTGAEREKKRNLRKRPRHLRSEVHDDTYCGRTALRQEAHPVGIISRQPPALVENAIS